jgi:hypothetical protein
MCVGAATVEARSITWDLTWMPSSQLQIGASLRTALDLIDAMSRRGNGGLRGIARQVVVAPELGAQALLHGDHRSLKLSLTACRTGLSR